MHGAVFLYPPRWDGTELYFCIHRGGMASCNIRRVREFGMPRRAVPSALECDCLCLSVCLCGICFLSPLEKASAIVTRKWCANEQSQLVPSLRKASERAKAKRHVSPHFGCMPRRAAVPCPVPRRAASSCFLSLSPSLSLEFLTPYFISGAAAVCYARSVGRSVGRRGARWRRGGRSCEAAKVT